MAFEPNDTLDTAVLAYLDTFSPIPFPRFPFHDIPTPNSQFPIPNSLLTLQLLRIERRRFNLLSTFPCELNQVMGN